MDKSTLTNLLDTRDAATVMATIEPRPPFTDSALTANLVCRVLLAIIANLTCLVPLRLLYRNGEFAAVVFILNIEIKNLDTIVNTLIWRNDNIRSWWAGYGWCDVDAYIQNITIGLFITCLLSIMRNLAQQVGLMRVNALSVQERRRRNLIQALIIFPFPIVQLVLTWPLTAQRYIVGTLIGCNWVPHPSWPFLLFFVLPPPIFALITTGYAVLIYKRFRQVSKTTQTALTSNHVAQRRAQRARRRLYLMVISILIPFLPVVIALAAYNILQMKGVGSYSYDQVHNHAFPLPWNTILFVTSGQINWALMNNCYIPIFTAIPIFVFFGLTKDAVNSYRQMALSLGLGKPFPGLLQEYDPNKAVSTGGSSFGSRQTRSIISTPAKIGSPDSPGPSCRHLSFGIENVQGQQLPNGCLQAVHNTEPSTASRLPGQNPFLFCTRYNISVPPFLRRLFARKREPQVDAELGSCLQPVHSICPPDQSFQAPGQYSIQTTVWSNKTQESDSLSIARKPMAGAVQVQTCLSRQS